jgi:branched-subunit amino acid aminotransferase/4-amino-4-deoxychorismate lyase
LITAGVRVPARDPIARIKSCNKLAQILARSEAEAAGADEALLLNTGGEVTEASSGNLFWIENGRVFTPPLDAGVLSGVTRSVVWDLCPALGVGVAERALLPEDLMRAEGAFLTQSSLGVIEVASVDRNTMPKSDVTARLSAGYWQLVEAEVSSGG